MIPRFTEWLLWTEGSTRSAGLLRIALALLLWNRWGSDFLLYKLAGPTNIAIALSFFGSTTLLLLGLWTRVATVWTALTMLVVFFYLGVAQGVEAYTHHHTWLLVSFSVLLVLTPCGRSLSLDRWRALARAERGGAPCPPERGPVWGLRLLALQTSVVYIGATANKLNLPFLSGARLQHVYADRYGGGDPIDLPAFAAICCVFAVLTVAMEALLAVGLWIPRFQVRVAILGLLFHAALYVPLPVGPFSATMAALYLAFFDPDAVHRAIDKLLGRPASSAEVGAAA